MTVLCYIWGYYNMDQYLRMSSQPSHNMAFSPPVNTASPTGVSFDATPYSTKNAHLSCAGRHFILDLWGAQNLEDIQFIEQALRDAASVAGAVLLHAHLHKFGEAGGVTGVALLAESHISIHTWPELDYAAFDVFMCGNAMPEKAVECLTERFNPEKTEVKEVLRGKQTT